MLSPETMTLLRSAKKDVDQNKDGEDGPKLESVEVDLIENKIPDQITLLSKIKSKEKEDERQEIYIPPEKSRLLITWDCFDTI